MVEHGLVAVVGAACRLPGGVNDLNQLHDVLVRGTDVVTRVPADRFSTDRWASGSGPGLSYTQAGGFLDSVADFDASYFGISPREASQIDPQQRLLLEMTVEAFDSAGIDPATVSGAGGGVFVGVSTRGYVELLSSRPTVFDAHTFFGSLSTNTANRVSYLLDWRGPSLAIDTACSSALVAVHQAVQAITSGEVPIAVAAGVSVMLNPVDYVGFSQAGVLSRSGRCRTFSARADGFVRAEGGGVLLLKRLADAEADGDPILGVIAGTGVKTDGASGQGGLGQPSETAQQALLEETYAASGISADQLVYLECHGTGTPVGDPIECSAIGATLGVRREAGRRLPIGSVKTNLGHLECASGMAGLLKALLVLRHRHIPASLHSHPLNPAIDFEALGLLPVADLLPVQPRFPAAVGVNSFGIGGANAHVILTEAPERAERATVSIGSRPVVVSAGTPEALAEAAWAMADLLGDTDNDGAEQAVSFYDVAYTSVLRRQRHRYTAVALAENATDAARALYDLAAGGSPRGTARIEMPPRAGTARDRPLGFVFTGNGAQWVGMASTLMADGGDAVFANTVWEIDSLLRRPLGWSVATALASGDYDLTRTEVAQPLLFAVQMGLVGCLERRGVRPAAVVGHSVGEIAAACVAGVLDLEEACDVLVRRSAAQGRTAGTGAMAAAGISESAATGMLDAWGGSVVVSAVNSATEVTLSGECAALREIGEHLRERAVFFRMLPLDYAFHSHLMDPVREEILTGLSSIRPVSGRVRLFSTVTGAVLDGASMDAVYWWDNVRQPVLFAAAIEAMLADGTSALLEIGPHPALSGYLRRLTQDRDGTCPPLATLRRDAPADLDGVVAAVTAAGGGVDHTLTFPQPGRVVDLPAYPWQRERHWIGDPSWWGSGPGNGLVEHPLLGGRIAVADPHWEGPVELTLLPWLTDHQVAGAVVMPGTAFVEMALAAARAAAPGVRMQVRDLAVTDALTVPSDGRTTQVRMATTVRGDTCTISSQRTDPRLAQPSGAWQQHARGRLRPVTAPAPRPVDVGAIGARLTHTRAGSQFYTISARVGTVYGKHFQGLTRLRWRETENEGPSELLAEYTLAQPIATEMTAIASAYIAHPVLLDVIVQACGPLLAAFCHGSSLFVPTEFGAVTVWSPPPTSGMVHARLRSCNGRDAVLHFTVIDHDGRVAITLEGVRTRLLDVGARQPIGAWDVVQRPAPAPVSGTPVSDRWVVAADDRGTSLATCLSEALGAGEVLGVRTSAPSSWEQALTATGAGRTHLALALFGGTHPDPVQDATVLCQVVREITTAWQTRSSASNEHGRQLVLWLLTGMCGALPGTLTQSRFLAQAAAWGTARGVANEYPTITVRRVMVERAEGTDLTKTAQQLSDLLRAPLTDEDEFTLDAQGVQVPRVVATSPPPGPAETGMTSTVLRVTQVAMAPTFTWEAVTAPVPGPGQVVIDVRAAALNYKDIMLATGLMPAEPEQSDLRGSHPVEGPLIGQECAGVITVVGAGVSGLFPGQAVMAIALGSLADQVVAEAIATVAIPETMSFTDAATLPLVYATAHYSLDTLACLSEGETLLLPGGAGGVGLAALTLARQAGARVIALAGTPEKRALLVARGAAHALDSRSLDFAAQVRELTAGRGVDVVLNSLTGAAAAACLELLAPDGRFVELGKRDLYADGDLRLKPFLNTLSYFAVDLAQLFQRRPTVAGTVLADIAQLASDGEITPLPHTLYPAAEFEEAFALLKRSGHTGKIVIDTASVPVPASRPRHVTFDPHGAYLVVGGTGGFGAETAKWLIANGAGQVVVTGRSAAPPPRDGQPLTVSADVTDPEAMGEVVTRAHRMARHGLKGVFHCATLYDDAPLTELDAGRFGALLAPKLGGAVLLDRLTEHLGLDHFVLFSSIVALGGNRNQSSYSAANLAVEALARDRHERGLPAVAVGWSAISDTGIIARAKIEDAMAGLGMQVSTPAEALHTLGLFLNDSTPPYVAIGRVDWSRMRRMFHSGTAARYSELSPGQDNTRGDVALQVQLAVATDAQAQILIHSAVTTAVAGLLRIAPDKLDPTTPMDRLGVDSLLATELTVVLRDALGTDVPVLEILSSRGVADLAERLTVSLTAGRARPETQA